MMDKANKPRMGIFSRLRLRENWPLWVAGGLCIFAVLYLLIFLLRPLRYPYEEAIIYPFIVIYSATTLPISCVALVSLIFAVGWTAITGDERHFAWVAPTTLVGSVILCAASPTLSILGIAGSLITLIVAAFRRNRRQGSITLLIVVAAVGLFLPMFEALFVGFQHRDSLLLGNHRYNLALIRDTDMDCHDEYLVVYQCDSLGFLCQPLERWHHYGQCLGYVDKEAPSQVSLIADTEGEVFVVMDGERFPVTP